MTYGVAYGYLTLSQQVAAAQRQIQAATAGQPLTALTSEVHPPEMLEPPQNAQGAAARVAYWLGAAARPPHPGWPAQPALLTAARAALARAQAGEGWFTSRIFTTESGTIRSQLADAAALADRFQRRDAAAVLSMLAQTSFQQTGAVDALVGTAAARTRAVVVSGVAVVGIGALVATAYLLGPVLVSQAVRRR